MDSSFSYGNTFNHFVYMYCFNTAWFMIHPQQNSSEHVLSGSEASLPDLFSVIQALRLWRRSLERLNMCSLLFGYISFCLCVLLSPVYTNLFFPLPRVALSSLFILRFARTIFSSGTQHRYFPILHVACWVSSRCQLPCWVMHSPSISKSFTVIAG